jgi:hypothetical protein
MSDIATLGLAIDATGALKATSALDSLAASGRRAEQVAKQLNATQSRAADIARINAEQEQKYMAAQARRAQAQRQMAAETGRQQAQAMSEALEREFRSDSARIKEAQARGFLTPQQAREAGRLSAEAYNRGTLEVLQRHQGALRGAAGQETYTRIAGSLKNVEQESRKAGIGLQSMRGPLTTITTQLAHANPAVGQLASMVGSFALGTGMMIGVMAGLAALAYGWNKVTAESRAAKEEAKENLEQLREIRRQRLLGEDGELGGTVREGRRAVSALEERLAGGGLTPVGRAKIEDELRERRALLRVAEAELREERADREEQKRNDDEAAHRQALADQKRRQEEELEQWKAHWQRVKAEQFKAVVELARAAGIAGIPGALAGMDPARVVGSIGPRIAGSSGVDAQSNAERMAGHTQMVRELQDQADAEHLAAVHNLISAVGSLSEEAGRGAQGLMSLVRSIQMIQENRGGSGLTSALNVAGGVLGAVSAVIQIGSLIGQQSRAQQEMVSVQKENNERLKDLRLGLNGFKLTEKLLTSATDAARSLAAETSKGGRGSLASQFAGDARSDQALLQGFLTPYGIGFHQFVKIAEEAGIQLLDSTGNVVVPAFQQLAEAMGYLQAETDAATRSMANIPDTAPIALWRYRTAGGGVSPTSTSSTGDTFVIQGDFVSTATNADEVFQQVRARAERDVRLGGRGFSRTFANPWGSA